MNLNTNLSAATLYKHALQREAGTALSNHGALVAFSGAKTGRSPNDKRITCESPSKDSIWWGSVNKPFSPQSFSLARDAAVSFLDKQPIKYTVLGFAGADPLHRLKVKVECSRAYHALFMQNMLIRPSEKELEEFGELDFTIYNAGQCDADPSIDGVESKTLVALSFEKKEAVILGTE
ncbi:UNVERIFIED_CONTAM: Protein kinase C-like 1 [Siphonaria sp. JEL0065]|nr:Protein kinase C-like 1 [Siphonaria sp. JEL0065]